MHINFQIVILNLQNFKHNISRCTSHFPKLFRRSSLLNLSKRHIILYIYLYIYIYIYIYI